MRKLLKTAPVGLLVIELFSSSLSATGPDIMSEPGWQDRCRAREWRCELRCGDHTPGGSQRRLDCYDECRAREQECRRDQGGA